MTQMDDRTAYVILENGVRVGPGRLIEENDTYLYMKLFPVQTWDEPGEAQIYLDRILYIEYKTTRREDNE